MKINIPVLFRNMKQSVRTIFPSFPLAPLQRRSHVAPVVQLLVQLLHNNVPQAVIFAATREKGAATDDAAADRTEVLDAGVQRGTGGRERS